MPDAIRLDYEKMEAMRAKIGLVTAQQENELKREETAKKSAIIAAQADFEVERINMARKVAAISGERELSRIESTFCHRFAEGVVECDVVAHDPCRFHDSLQRKSAC